MGREKQEEKSRRSKERLLEAAAALFNEKKIEEVGVREISALAGMTTGTFYHYFTGKDQILDQLYSDRDEEFNQILKQYHDGDGPYCEKIIDFFSCVLSGAVIADGVDFTKYRMLQMQKHSTDKHLLYIGMKSLIKQAVRYGELHTGVSVSEINEYLFMVFRGIVYEWCISSKEDGFSLEKKVKTYMTFALNSFR